MTTPRTVFEPGNGTLEIFDLDPSENVLFELLKDVFEKYWEDIVFGILIQGAAWEIKASNKPESVNLYDGYLTIDFGAWHLARHDRAGSIRPRQPRIPTRIGHMLI